jgi:hypothetical protein
MSEIGTSLEDTLAYVRKTPPAQGETMLDVPFERHDAVRIGFVGVGGRGFGQMKNVLACEGARAVAISDPNEENVRRATEHVATLDGQPTPAVVPDWRTLCARDDVDLVYLCTPWELHVPPALRAMECGKHTAVEVPAAITLEECWQLVDTSEKTHRHCVILENCCYGQSELLALNLVRAGLLGTVTHGEAAYVHDLRELLLRDRGEGLWRRAPHVTRDGNLYPTHGLGPVAWYMGIHRGDRFERLVSMSSREAALSEYRDAHLAADDAKRKETYRCGDMNSSLIRTARGRTILLQHDVVTPRPYTRLNLVAGSKGTFADYPPRVFLDGQESHAWRQASEFEAEHGHALWKELGERAKSLGGHGGVDFLTNYRLIHCMREGLPPDMDVYDAAAWSAPGPLSEMSVACGNAPLPFPDFTRGKWQTRPTGPSPVP